MTIKFHFSYPLLNFSPLPGKIPTKVVLPYHYQSAGPSNVSAETTHFEADKKLDEDDSDQSKKNFSLPFPSPMQPWARLEPPFVFVQQIILRSVVLPWNKDLVLTDAFRGPLFEVFKLLEIINNHETNVTLSNLCLHVENVKRSHKDALFPEYNCLVLSPANFWKQNIHSFNKDNSLLGTIYQHHV